MSLLTISRWQIFLPAVGCNWLVGKILAFFFPIQSGRFETAGANGGGGLERSATSDPR